MSNIFFGKTNYDCVNGLIERLKQNYLDESLSHVFIVPDRISMLTEIKIFESLNIQSSCNIEVLTLSRLASKILQGVKVISKPTSCMILQKIIKDNKQSLKCFTKNINADLANNLFETISQFKSCKIKFDEVTVNTKNSLLQEKLEDISLLYKKYQEYLLKNHLLDSMDRLDILSSEIKNIKNLSSTCVYVGNFDSFTFQGFQLINELIKNCYEFNIGLTKSDNPLNEHIYNSDFTNSVLKLFEINNNKPNIIFCPETAEGEVKHIQDNLFAYKPQQMQINTDGLVELYEASSFEEELTFVCSTIKNNIIKNKLSFKDFVLCIPNLEERQKQVERVLSGFDFSYYIDVSQNFENSLLVRFIKQLIDILIENFSKDSVLSVVKSIFFDADFNKKINFEDYINKFNVNDFAVLKSINIEDEKYEDFCFIKNKLFDYFNCALNCNCKTYDDYINLFKNLLINFNCEEKLNELSKKFYESGDTKQQKNYEQYLDKLLEIFNNITSVLGQEECNLKLFNLTLFSGIKATKVSTTPISTNSIFVGDLSVSFFDKAKVYYILDCSEKNFPHTIVDMGLISDKDISELSESYKLSPSVSEINFKERFRAFEILLSAKEKLYLSYNYETNGSQKSKILDDIAKMFCVIDNKNQFNTLKFRTYNTTDFLTKNNNYFVAKTNFIDKYREYLNGQEENLTEVVALYKFLNLNKKFLSNFNYVNNPNIKTEIFFNKNTVSVSQVEKFMSCPFMHFAKYGLKIKENDLGELNSLNIGNILHEVAENFIKNNSLPINEKSIDKIARSVFKKVISVDKYVSILNNTFNKALIKNLEEEAVRFCSALNYQVTNSSFRPQANLLEAEFDDKNTIKSLKIKIKNKILKLVGKIDRIDIFNDYFRIIDYKTGKCDRSYKELFFGKKIQLEAYMKVVENSLRLKPAGAYYLPVKSAFTKAEETKFDKYQLNGRTLKLDEVINASDNRFNSNYSLTSDLVEIKYNKNSIENRTLSAYAKVLSLNEIQNMANYAIALLNQACLDIESNNIAVSPLVLGNDSACKNCCYYSLCRFDESFGNQKRNPQSKVELKNFSNEVGEEKDGN